MTIYSQVLSITSSDILYPFLFPPEHIKWKYKNSNLDFFIWKKKSNKTTKSDLPTSGNAYDSDQEMNTD